MIQRVLVGLPRPGQIHYKSGCVIFRLIFQDLCLEVSEFTLSYPVAHVTCGDSDPTRPSRLLIWKIFESYVRVRENIYILW